MFRRKRGPEIKQEIYYTKRVFEKESKKMLRKGWEIINLNITHERPAAILLPILGLASLVKVETYHVTWRKI